jgi:glycosyltransferase involved in cell wall biosynthesis
MPDKEPCIVHAFHNKAVKTLAWCGTLWRLLDRPVGCVAHRGVIYPPNNILPYIAPGIHVFAANSLACLKTLPLFWRKAAGRVIYNCVPKMKVTPTRSPDDVRAELGIGREAAVVGCVSNNAPVKGLEILIRAFAKIAGPGLILCIVGANTDKWASLCAELGIAGSARIVMRTEHVADYMQIFTLFALPSLSESSPNTLLEAMCMGLPAVCSRVGGVPECVSDPRYLVPPGNADALAAAIAAALGDRKSLAEAADRNLAFSGQFSVKRKLDLMEEIYADLLKPYMRKQDSK